MWRRVRNHIFSSVLSLGSMNPSDPLCSGSTMKSMASSDLKGEKKGVPFLFSEEIDLGILQSMPNSTALPRQIRL